MRDANKFESEVELARCIVAYFQEQRYEVYQEVQPWQYGSVADIVATFGARLVIAECKLSLGLAVLQQASDWVGWANMVYVAVPQGARNSNFGFGTKLAVMLGVGVLAVSHSSYEHDKYSVKEVGKPLFHRHSQQDSFRKILTERHKTFAEAGNPLGKRYTPFQATCETLRKQVRLNPGRTMKETVGAINTHYSTPRSAVVCLSKLIWENQIDGVRLEKDGRAVRIYPA
jgi:hypothetical protein